MAPKTCLALVDDGHACTGLLGAQGHADAVDLGPDPLLCRVPSGLDFCTRVDYPVHSSPEGAAAAEFAWMLLDEHARDEYTALVRPADSDECLAAKRELACGRTFLACGNDEEALPVCRSACYELAHACKLDNMHGMCTESELYRDDDDASGKQCTRYGRMTGWKVAFLYSASILVCLIIGCLAGWLHVHRREKKLEQRGNVYQMVDAEELTFIDE